MPKHTISPSRDDDSPRKRARSGVSTNPIVIDDDDDMDVILARIKEQEDNERLIAQLLQEEGGSSIAGPSNLPSNHISSDEALARKLTREWEEVMEIDSQSDEVIVIDDGASDDHISISSGLPIEDQDDDSHSDEAAISPDEHLSEFRTLFTTERSCSGCSKAIPSPRGFVVFKNLTGAIPAALSRLLHVFCSSCTTSHCRGCFKSVPCKPNCKGSADCPVVSCCAELRAIALFEALGGLDRLYLGERASSDTRAQKSLGKKKTSGGSGVGYGSGWGGRGRGRGRAKPYGAATEAAGSSRRKELDDHWDELLMVAFATITSFLPSPFAEDALVHDMLPHPSIKSLLLASYLPALLAGLLRNDSVADWIAREPLYQSMISLLRRLSDSELTAPVLTGRRWEIKQSPGLEAWMWEEGDLVWEDTDEEAEPGPPIYHHFQRLTKQCQAFLAGVSQTLETADETDDTLVKGMSLCGDIIAASDAIDRTCSILSKLSKQTGQKPNGKASASGKGKTRAVEPKDLGVQYANACEKTAFKYVLLRNDGGQYTNFHFYKEIQFTQNSTRNPKDRLHLIKELAVMATSLPPGIWVRVDEVRNDVIKVIIAGPDSTPYARGLFEFDCFIPLQYPHVPPVMHLRTTGGGRVRFNPNLYNCGKVCLSLLGTWQGRPEEQWTPKSTLLQVFVSIQSMIFVELPYFNEPGYGKPNARSPQSIAYNTNIVMETTRWAIVDWLVDKQRSSFWADVIKSHFTIWEDAIRSQIAEWAQLNFGIKSYGGRNLLTDYDMGIQRIQTWVVE